MRMESTTKSKEAIAQSAQVAQPQTKCGAAWAQIQAGKRVKDKISYRKMLMAAWNHKKASASKKHMAHLRNKHRKLLRHLAG